MMHVTVNVLELRINSLNQISASYFHLSLCGYVEQKPGQRLALCFFLPWSHSGLVTWLMNNIAKYGLRLCQHVLNKILKQFLWA